MANSIMFFGLGDRATALAGAYSVYGPSQGLGSKDDPDMAAALGRAASAKARRTTARRSWISPSWRRNGRTARLLGEDLTRLRESDGTDDPRSIQHRERWHRGDRSGALRGGVWSQRRISVEHLACDGGRRFGGVGFDSAAAIRRRWRCSTRFHDLPPGGGPRWCLACLSNCGYLQCTVASRSVRLDS